MLLAFRTHTMNPSSRSRARADRNRFSDQPRGGMRSAIAFATKNRADPSGA